MNYALFIMTLLLFTSACAAPAPDATQSPATQSPAAQPPGAQSPATQPAVTQKATVAPVKLSQRCTNTNHGFTVSYPAGWHTSDASVIPACTAFHPEPFTVPRDSEMPADIAVVFHVDKVPVEDLTRSSEWERVLSVSPASVAGRQGYRMEVEATGQGLADRGMRTFRYAVALGDGRTLIASTHSAAAAYERNKEVLSRMVGTVRTEDLGPGTED